MKTININDIENLILTKHEIDLLRIENNEIETKSSLKEFMDNYATPKYIYLYNGKTLAFNFINIYDHHYLFVDSDNEENELIINKIKHLKYNMNNLVKLTNLDIINMIDVNNVIIHNGCYYN